MDEHSQRKNQNNGKVGVRHLREERKVPRASDLVNHIAGGFPGDLIRFGRVEIGTGSEEQARRSDEDECQNDVPSKAQAGERFLEKKSVEQLGVNTGKNESAPDGDNSPKRRVMPFAGNGRDGGDKEHQDGAHFDFLLAPLRVCYHSESVQSAPDDEIPAGAVPESADKLRNHGVHVFGDCLAGVLFEECAQTENQVKNPQGESDPDASRKHNRNGGNDCRPKERAESCAPVSAERNIHVIA